MTGQTIQSISEIADIMSNEKFDEASILNVTNLATTLMDRAGKGEAQAVETAVKWNRQPFMKHIRKHAERVLPRGTKYDLSQQETAGLIELAGMVYEEPGPMIIGRDLCRIEMMSSTIKRVRIRARAKAGKVARGGKAKGDKSVVSRFELIQAEDVISSSTEWDQKTLEDLEWDGVSDDTRGAVESVMEDESQLIIDELISIPAGETAGGVVLKPKTQNEFKYEDMVNIWKTLQVDKYAADTMAINPNEMASLLTDSKFIDSTMLGEFMNPATGKFGKALLGMQVLCSTQIPMGKIIAMEKKFPLIYAIRRDRMLEPYNKEGENGAIHGITVSTRYGMTKAVPKGMVVMDSTLAP